LPELIKLMPKVAALTEAIATTFVKRATVADVVGKLLTRAYGGLGRGTEYLTSLGGRYPSRVSGAFGSAAIPYEDILKNLGKERGFFGGLRPEHERAVRQARDIFGRARLATLLGVGGAAAMAGTRGNSEELTPNLNVDEDKTAATKTDLIKFAIEAGVNEGRVRYIASQIKDAGDRRARRGRWRKKNKGESKQDTWQQRYGKPAGQEMSKASNAFSALMQRMPTSVQNKVLGSFGRAISSPAAFQRSGWNAPARAVNWMRNNPGKMLAAQMAGGGLLGGAISPGNAWGEGAITGAALGAIPGLGMLGGGLLGGIAGRGWGNRQDIAELQNQQPGFPPMYGLTPQASMPLMTKDAGLLDNIAAWIYRRGARAATAAPTARLSADPYIRKAEMTALQNLTKELETKRLVAEAAKKRQAAQTAMELPSLPVSMAAPASEGASAALPSWLGKAGQAPLEKAAILPEMLAGAGLGRMMAMGAGGGLGGGYALSRFVSRSTFGRMARGAGRPLMTVGALSLGLPLAMAFAGRPVTKIQIGDTQGGRSPEMDELKELMQLRLLANMAKGVGDTGAAVGRSAAGGLRDIGELVQ
jgi:hypothetical protein